MGHVMGHTAAHGPCHRPCHSLCYRCATRWFGTSRPSSCSTPGKPVRPPRGHRMAALASCAGLDGPTGYGSDLRRHITPRLVHMLNFAASDGWLMGGAGRAKRRTGQGNGCRQPIFLALLVLPGGATTIARWCYYYCSATSYCQVALLLVVRCVCPGGDL